MRHRPTVAELLSAGSGTSSYHEDTYYYRFLPENGFAIQRIYTRDTDLDVPIPVQHGDVVLIHAGYHPVIKAPCTNACYLNFLAGEFERFRRSTILLTIG